MRRAGSRVAGGSRLAIWMRTPLAKRLLTLALGAASLLLAACNYDRTPNFLGETAAPKIQPDYRKKIVEWASRYYAEPGSVRFLAISDPVRVRESAGLDAWLVCVELDARERGGAYMGPRRIAIGFGAGIFSAPMERSNHDLKNEDCDARHLVWRAWGGPGRGRP
jgi:hypothetical protein